MHLREALRSLTDALVPAAGDLAGREAEIVLMHLSGRPRNDLHLDGSGLLAPAVQERLAAIVAARLRGEPLAYVLGEGYFHSVTLALSPGALIPRPDTETLVEAVLEQEPAEPRFFLDLCTGSGAVAAALLHNRPRWTCAATDISSAALAVAARNLRRGCALACGDRLQCLANKAMFDFIVANPPYVPSGTIAQLEPGVRDFEPRLALDGGPDGLDFYRYLAEQAAPRMHGGARLYCEIGFDQREQVVDLLRQHGWQDIGWRPDLAGRPRVVQARRPPC